MGGEQSAFGGSASIATQEPLLAGLDERHIEVVVQHVPGGARNLQDIYPLSSLQEGMLFHHLLNDQQDTYVLSTAFELQSAVQLALLVDAVQKVVDRHTVLRTAILWENLPKPMQVVYRQVQLSVLPLVLDSTRDPVEQLKERMQPRSSGMDLRIAPLMELHATPHSVDGRWYALLRVHHLICDHQSLRSIEAEIIQCIRGREQELPTPVAYRSYVERLFALGKPKEAEEFFRSRLADIDESTAPFELIDVHGDGAQIIQVQQPLDPLLAHLVREQSRRMRVSALRIFHAAWALVVAHTTGRDDIVFGTVLLASEQRGAARDQMLGMAVNTLPLRVNLSGMTAQQLVESVSQELTELLTYQQTPLPLAQRCSGLADGVPLFTTLLNCRRTSPEAASDEDDLAVRVLVRGEAWTNYPITLTVDDTGDQFVLTLQADRRIDPDRLIAYLQTGMRSLVSALERAPHTSALSLPVLPEAERRQLIVSFNATEAFYPHAKTIHEVFQEQVKRAPEASAVVYEGQSLTYAQLSARANQLARHLRAKGVGPDAVVGICIDRSIEMMVAVLGVLKAGGAYMPLDPAYPDERLAGMVEDAAARVVLTQERLRNKLKETKAESIALDSSWSDIARNDSSDLDSKTVGTTTNQLAYVIYTSGSTGKPKGVMIEHQCVLNLWQGLEQLYAQSVPCRRVAQNASLSFDASVQQLVQLLSGRTLYLIPQDVRQDPSLLVSFINEYRIEAIDCTPSQLKLWIAADLQLDRCSLRFALVGGEAIDAQLWSTLSQCSETAFYNVYGPTECTVDSTVARLNDDGTAPHIGRPMPNRRVYILDRGGQPAAIGVAGEIYIGGVGVARGYLNRPELTTERFRPDPFSGDLHARMYKTGDLGRWRADGTIEYLGRNDDQVKVRGFRIELGEIEVQLARCAGVKESVVLVREDEPGEKRLVAYVVPGSKSDVLSVEELREYLRGVLPDYMVPSAIVILERVPLTPSGKVNRRALPAPGVDAYVTRGYEAPQGEIEQTLARIWQSLLRVERVGRHDNFFELGGHSIIATRVVSQIREQLQVELPMRVLFDEPVVARMAVRIEAARNGTAENEPFGKRRRVGELRQQINEMHDEAVLLRIAELEQRLSEAKG